MAQTQQAQWTVAKENSSKDCSNSICGDALIPGANILKVKVVHTQLFCEGCGPEVIQALTLLGIQLGKPAPTKSIHKSSKFKQLKAKD